MSETPVTLRDVGVDEAVAIAIQLQRHGRLADAEGVYRKVLAVLPDHPDALHFTGVLAHQQGRHEEAIALIERSLGLAPDQADWHSNLGIVLKSLGRVDEAATAYERAIALDPRHARAQNNLGVLRKAQGRLDEAETAYRTAIDLDARYIEAHQNLGLLLYGRGRTRDAMDCFCRATTLSPRHPDLRRLQAMAHCTLGEVDQAIDIFRQWLAEEPDNEIAQHMLAACTGEGVPPRASDGFVEWTFDRFAESFDAKLARLSYRAPALVEAMLEDAGVARAQALDVLDAGCGTGLCGPLVAPYAPSLVGVYLSGGMLERAKERQLYTELVKGELTAYLREHPGSFDVIVSADTLVYFGPLDEVIAAAAAALRPAGVVIFTIEELADGAGAGEYRLCTHGRYSHTQAYVSRLLRAAGLRPEIVRAELRMEGGVPVPGLAVRAAKEPGAGGPAAMRATTAAGGA